MMSASLVLVAMFSSTNSLLPGIMLTLPCRQATDTASLIKFNVLRSPDVSCATDDATAALLTSVHTFISSCLHLAKRFIPVLGIVMWREGQLSLYSSRFLSRVLPHCRAGLLVVCLTPYCFCPKGQIPKPVMTMSVWKASAWGPWQICSLSRTSTPKHSNGVRRLWKRLISTSKYVLGGVSYFVLLVLLSFKHLPILCCVHTKHLVTQISTEKGLCVCAQYESSNVVTAGWTSCHLLPFSVEIISWLYLLIDTVCKHRQRVTINPILRKLFGATDESRWWKKKIQTVIYVMGCFCVTAQESRQHFLSPETELSPV